MNSAQGIEAYYRYARIKLAEKLIKKPVIWLPSKLLSNPEYFPKAEVTDWLREYSHQAKVVKVYLQYKVIFPNEAEMIHFKLSFDCPQVEPDVYEPDYVDAVLALIQIAFVFGTGFLSYTFLVMIKRLISNIT